MPSVPGDDTVFVEQDEVKAAYWSPHGKTRYLTTAGLNGCTGVAIVSKAMGILAHIAPIEPDGVNAPVDQDRGRANHIEKVQRVIDLHNENRPLLEEANTLIVAAIWKGEMALPWAINIIQKVFEQLKLPCKVETYTVLAPQELRAPGQTSIVIDARTPNAQPKIYINNQEI